MSCWADRWTIAACAATTTSATSCRPTRPYREQTVAAIRERAERYGVTAFKTGLPGYYEWLDTHARITEAVDQTSYIT